MNTLKQNARKFVDEVDRTYRGVSGQPVRFSVVAYSSAAANYSGPNGFVGTGPDANTTKSIITGLDVGQNMGLGQYTNTAAGMSLARQTINADNTAKGKRTDEQYVVLLFSDGEPTAYYGTPAQLPASSVTYDVNRTSGWYGEGLKESTYAPTTTCAQYAAKAQANLIKANHKIITVTYGSSSVGTLMTELASPNLAFVSTNDMTAIFNAAISAVGQLALYSGGASEFAIQDMIPEEFEIVPDTLSVASTLKYSDQTTGDTWSNQPYTAPAAVVAASSTNTKLTWSTDGGYFPVLPTITAANVSTLPKRIKQEVTVSVTIRVKSTVTQADYYYDSVIGYYLPTDIDGSSFIKDSTKSRPLPVPYVAKDKIITIDITKAISAARGTAPAGTFHFGLYTRSGDTLVPVQDGNPAVNVTGQITGAGIGTISVSLNALKIDGADKTFVVKEILPGTPDGRWAYDATEKEITISKAGVVAYGAALTRLTFTNTYTEYGKLTITKVKVGGPADDTFNFTVKLGDANGDGMLDNYNGNVLIGEDTVAITNGALTLSGGQSAVIASVLCGTAYSVSETAKAGYTGEVTSTDAASGSIAGDVVVAFTNTYDVGKLTISKHAFIDPNLCTPCGSEDGENLYAFKLTLLKNFGVATPAGATLETDGSYTFTLASGASIDFTNIPAGTTYTLEETDSFGADSVYINEDAGTSYVGTIAKGNNTANVYNNFYTPGVLTVRKAVTGSAATAGYEYGFKIKLYTETDEETEPELTCEIPEHTHDDSCYDELSMICELPEHTHDADCYSSGTEIVQHPVILSDILSESEFAATGLTELVDEVSGEPTGEYTFKLTAGGFKTFDFLDIDTYYEITETASDGAKETTITGDPTDVTEQRENKEVTFTNDFSVSLGSMTIKKTVVDEDNLYGDGAFTFTVAFTKDNEPYFNKDFDAELVLDGETPLYYTFTLVDGGSLTFGNLPKGVSYTITETNAQGANQTKIDGTVDSDRAVTGTIGTASRFVLDTPEYEFTNEYLMPETGIDLEKSVSSSSVRENGTVTYTLVVTNTGDTALEGITLSDTMLGSANDGSLSVTSGGSNLSYNIDSETGDMTFTEFSLLKGASITITYTHTFTNRGTYTNDAAVVGYYNRHPASDEDSKTVTVTRRRIDDDDDDDDDDDEDPTPTPATPTPTPIIVEETEVPLGPPATPVPTVKPVTPITVTDPKIPLAGGFGMGALGLIGAGMAAFGVFLGKKKKDEPEDK